MSRRPVQHPACSVRRTHVPALGLTVLAVAVLATPAGAATPRFATIEQPLQASAPAQTATGDGHVAWAVPEKDADTGKPTNAIWTLRDGAPVRVASIPAAAYGTSPLEVGTATDGVPVAVLTTVAADEVTPVIRLIDLQSGATKAFSSTRRGLRVGGVAVDHGRLSFTLHPKAVGKRNTSALWRAPLTGLRVGSAKKLRTSRRGEAWSQVLADRGRVAIRTDRVVRSGGRDGRLEQIAFGTPSGSWNRTGDVVVQEGPVDLVAIAGFTQDRGAVVTLQSPDGGTLRATATPIAPKAAARRAFLGSGPADSIGGASYVPATGRFLGVGPDPAGTRSVGYTAPVFEEDAGR